MTLYRDYIWDDDWDRRAVLISPRADLHPEAYERWREWHSHWSWAIPVRIIYATFPVRSYDSGDDDKEWDR